MTEQDRPNLKDKTQVGFYELGSLKRVGRMIGITLGLREWTPEDERASVLRQLKKHGVASFGTVPSAEVSPTFSLPPLDDVHNEGNHS